MIIRQLFHLDSSSEQSLQKQIVEQIVAAIVRGHIPVDKPLPPSRALASQLGVARNTVTLAYYRLKDEGYLISKERSGFFVNPSAIEEHAVAPVMHATTGISNAPDWQSRNLRNPGLQRNIKKPSDWQSYPYPFIYGQVDYDLFPTHQWRECCRDAASVGATKDWVDDHFECDDKLLIEQVRQHLLPRRGVWANPNEIMITVGAQQALYMISSLFFGATRTVGLEDPGYVDVRNIAKLHGAKTIPLPVDEQGLVVSHKVTDCDYVYVTPSHQSPTTVTLPLERRYQLLDLAAQSDVVLIEDDYESEIAFLSTPTPALKSLDKCDRVIYVGSMSKTLAPGLRIGYLVAPAEVIAELRALRRLMLRHPAANNQRSAAIFIARGYYDSLRRQLVSAYEERCHTMVQALEQYLPDFKQTLGHGASSIWLEGCRDFDSRKLSKLAREQGVLIEPGDIHFLASDPPLNYFRLGYSSIANDKIEPGIECLSRLIEELV
ncbi:MAG: PLP-dependent aminotransferase family protein [Pseudomonadota bacterium]